MSSSCLYKTQPKRVLAQVCHTRIDALSPADGHAVKRLRLVGWTNGPMYRSKEGISGFGRTDGRADGQPENIMPPAPKGGGIIKQIALKSNKQ